MKYIIYENDDIDYILKTGQIMAEGKTIKEALLDFAKKMVLDDNNFILTTEKKFDNDRQQYFKDMNKIR